MESRLSTCEVFIPLKENEVSAVQFLNKLSIFVTAAVSILERSKYSSEVQSSKSLLRSVTSEVSRSDRSTLFSFAAPENIALIPVGLAPLNPERSRLSSELQLLNNPLISFTPTAPQSLVSIALSALQEANVLFIFVTAEHTNPSPSVSSSSASQ